MLLLLEALEPILGVGCTEKNGLNPFLVLSLKETSLYVCEEYNMLLKV